MKIKRILSLVILALFAFVLVACGETNNNDEKKDDKKQEEQINLLDTYLLNLPNVLTEDFTLDAQLKIGEIAHNLTWTSSDACVAIAENAVDGTYTVVVTRPSEAKEVKLTVSCEGFTKEFTFQVKPYDVYDLTGAFVFAQDKAIVASDFDLPTSFTYQGITATIVWESTNENLVKINETGDKALVTAKSTKTNVNLKATFTYNGKSSALRFTVTVFEEMDSMESINYWYSNTGVKQTLSGYVVCVATVYAPTYGNISLYILDDSYKAGYYAFRAKCDEATAAKIVPGAHVTVTESTNTCYNGLYETNAGGNVVVDEDVEPINITDTVVAIDDYLTANSPSLRYLQSTLVSITGWKITALDAAPARDATTTIMHVERDGVSLEVACTKYQEGYFSPWTKDADPKFDAIVTAYNELAVGDYVDITGMLSNYNGHRICVISGDLITKSEDKGETLGKAVNPVIAAVSIPEKCSEATTIALPAGEAPVTVTWKLAKASAVAKVENGNLVITPAEEAAQFTLIGTFANGDFSTSIYYTVKVGVADNTVKTIAAARALEAQAEATIQGTVMAVNEKGFILQDATDAIYVYVAGSTSEDEKAKTWAVGDTVKVEGKLDAYKGLIEFIPAKTEAAEIVAVEAGEAAALTVDEINAYVADENTNLTQDYVTFTGVLTVSADGKYFNIALADVENVEVSLSYPTEMYKNMLAGLNGKEITFSGYALGKSSKTVEDVVTRYFTVMINSIDSTLTIKGAKAAAVGTVVTIEGQVVASGERGYVVFDGEDAILVYAKDSKVTDLQTVYFFEGDFITVTGVRGFYGGDQIVPTAAEYLEETPESFDQGKAAVYGVDEVAAYVSAEATTFANVLVEFTGKVTISNGKYYNVLLDEAGNVQVSLYYMTEDQKAAYTEGETYTIYGYTVGQSSNKFMNVIPCTYVAPLDPYQEVYVEGALYVNPAFTAENCTWGGTALTFGTNGFADFNSAYAAAENGQSIYLQSGTYTVVNPGDAAFSLTKNVKVYGPNAEITGYAKQRHPEATLFLNIDKSAAQSAFTMNSKIAFYGVEIKGNGIGGVSGVAFEAGATAGGAIFVNCLINSVNTVLKVQNGSEAEYYFEGCKINGINQFFAWITKGTKSFTFVNNYFDATDCGKVGNANAALFRIRCAMDVKIYHNVFVGDVAESNPGWFEPNSTSTATSAGSFDIQYNEFNLVEKFYFANVAAGFDEKATMNNNIYTDGERASTGMPSTLENISLAGITKDTNMPESLEALEEAWAIATVTYAAPDFTEAPE